MARPAGLPVPGVSLVSVLPPLPLTVFFSGGRAAAALDREVLDAVAGVDHVVAAVAVEAVLAGLAEHRVGAGVADQDVPVEGALHVLVGRREVDASRSP